ncbi:MAG: RDD family protein [Defluviitaleaceae bacterium]|nr:RDD family protein [Defluviitaleaceae bacterium]
MLMRRMVANIIDLIVLIGSLALGVYLAGQVTDLFEEPFFLLTVSMVCLIILVPIGLQSLFWLESTTIGKTLVFIKVVRNEDGAHLDYFQMFVRDFLLKILSANLVTLPIFLGKSGIHDIIVDGKVIIKPKRGI